MIPDNTKLEDCVQKLTLEQAMDVVAAAKLAEEMRNYAASHDTPATGRTPYCYIRSKTKDGVYCVMEHSGSLVYCCIPILYFFNKKYNMKRNFELSRTYEVCSQYLGYDKTLELMTKRRTDFNANSSDLMWGLDKAYESLNEYFQDIFVSSTVDHLQRKRIGYIVS